MVDPRHGRLVVDASREVERDFALRHQSAETRNAADDFGGTAYGSDPPAFCKAARSAKSCGRGTSQYAQVTSSCAFA